jgi:hypothetical protein
MKNLATALVVLVSLASTAFAQTLSEEWEKLEKQVQRHLAHKDTTKIIVKDGVVEIRASDMEDAVQALAEQQLLHRTATIKVYAAPRSKEGDNPFRLNTKGPEQRLSDYTPLIEGYKNAYDSILIEMEKQEPETAAKMKANPADLRGNLEHIEKYLGLDKVNAESKTQLLTTRCYRVCWAEEIYRYAHTKNVELIFE